MKILTPREVAERLALNDLRMPEEAVRRLRRRGLLQGVKIGRQWRYEESAVESFLKRAPRSKVVG